MLRDYSIDLVGWRHQSAGDFKTCDAANVVPMVSSNSIYDVFQITEENSLLFVLLLWFVAFERLAVPVQLQEVNQHAFWTIRDIEGWKHGTMVNGNIQQWKCNYCSITGRSGGVSGLKRHLVGHRGRAKKCPEVPEDVAAKINLLIKSRKEKRQKRAALKAPNNPAFIASAEPRDLIPSTSHGLISHVQKNCSSILRELAQGSIALAHVPGETCYCSFCTLEKANEGPEYEQMRLRLLQTKMVQVVDMMLSAAEKLSAEEQSVTMTK